MNLIERYFARVESGELQEDQAQKEVLTQLDLLSQQLSKSKKFMLNLRAKPIRGLYLYGSVGVGKTFLMDLFFDNLSIKEKLRLHFHHFMQQVDARLRELQGTKNPLQQIAIEIAKQTKVLCFDEFMVHDVADAMILGGLMQDLFARGIVLVATSNIAPDRLYWNGVQRDRFLPAIAAIKDHCQVIGLGERRDYRLGREPQLETYIYPLNEETTAMMCQQFKSLAPHYEEHHSIIIQNRPIEFIRKGDAVIWFDFRIICNLPRSQLDYLEIADQYETIFVSSLPQLTEKDTIFAILLIHFIDVMYDKGVRLVISAAVPLSELYQCGEMAQPFKRTLSRLEEMQSIDYLARHPHRKPTAFSTLA